MCDFCSFYGPGRGFGVTFQGFLFVSVSVVIETGDV